MASEVKTNKISPATSTTINVGDSGDTLALATDAVTGFQVGSDAQGDVLYHDGTDYTRLAAGTSGHFLKTQGTSANPVWAADNAGSLVWIAGAANNAAVSSIDFTDVFSATYSTYMVVFSMIKCDTTSESVFMSVGPSDLSSIRTGNYSYYFYSSTDGNTNAGNTSDANGFRVSGGGAATEGMSGVVYIYQPFSSADRTAFTATCNGRKLNWGFNIVGGQEISATSNESLRIKAGAGNIGSSSYNARIDIYGLKNS
tara:strand:- start:196 stop:963 length:768 start_codon:yes stop_codon:yes gene_type:complete